MSEQLARPESESANEMAHAWPPCERNSITGTLISIVTYGTAVTSFRGRLPSPSSKIAFHSSYLPGALSSLPLPNLLPNYFANKRNIFNVVFVKRAWGWTTLAWGLHWLAGIFAAQQQSAGGALNTSRSTRKRLVYRPLKRYALATVYWLLFTTWFFGPSISDRLLVLSGAQCVPSSLSSADASAAPPAAAGAQTANEPNHVILDHSHCTFGSPVLRAGSVEAGDDAARGASSASGLSGKVETPGAAQHRGKHGRKAYWKGGHDISGHSFLLTLSSLFLATEIAPTLSVLANGVHSGLTAATGAVAGSGRSTPTGPASRTKLESLPLRKYTALATVALITLWWWMLLVSAGFRSRLNCKVLRI